MRKKTAAGLLMYTKIKGEIKVFLAHHGGPKWEGKEAGGWDIPKGEVETSDNGNLKDVAIREFEEETGIKLEVKKLIELGSTENKYGKTIHIWAFEGKGNEKFNGSNTFEMEWPKRSGNIQIFPEMDKGEYFDLKTAKIKAHSYTRVFFDRLENHIKDNKEQKKLF